MREDCRVAEVKLEFLSKSLVAPSLRLRLMMRRRSLRPMVAMVRCWRQLVKKAMMVR